MAYAPHPTAYLVQLYSIANGTTNNNLERLVLSSRIPNTFYPRRSGSKGFLGFRCTGYHAPVLNVGCYRPTQKRPVLFIKLNETMYPYHSKGHMCYLLIHT